MTINWSFDSVQQDRIAQVSRHFSLLHPYMHPQVPSGCKARQNEVNWAEIVEAEVFYKSRKSPWETHFRVFLRFISICIKKVGNHFGYQEEIIIFQDLPGNFCLD